MIEIANEQTFIRVSPKRIRELTQLVLKRQKSKKTDMTILFCDNRTIKKYHNQYLGKDSATDVISFGTESKNAALSEVNYLGDIVVSAEMAKQVCQDYHSSARQELERYVVHGTLHLLGYEDDTEETHATMHRVQERYLKAFKNRGKR